MAFETQTNQNYAQLANLVEKSDPFSSMGKTMSELDGLLEQRRGKEYISGLDPEKLKTTSGAFAALQGASGLNKETQDQLRDNLGLAMKMEQFGIDKKKTEMDNLIQQQKMQQEKEKLGIEKEKLGIEKAKEESRVEKVKLEKKELDDLKLNEYEENKRGIELVDNLLNTEDFDDYVGWLEGKVVLSEGAKDFSEKLETLKNQVFMMQREKLKGQGSLSDNESNQAKGALASLERDQSEKSLRKNLGILKNILGKGITKYEDDYGITAKRQEEARIKEETKAAAKAKEAEIVEQAKAKQREASVNLANRMKQIMESGQDSEIFKNSNGERVQFLNGKWVKYD